MRIFNVHFFRSPYVPSLPPRTSPLTRVSMFGVCDGSFSEGDGDKERALLTLRTRPAGKIAQDAAYRRKYDPIDQGGCSNICFRIFLYFRVLVLAYFEFFGVVLFFRIFVFPYESCRVFFSFFYFYFSWFPINNMAFVFRTYFHIYIRVFIFFPNILRIYAIMSTSYVCIFVFFIRPCRVSSQRTRARSTTCVLEIINCIYNNAYHRHMYTLS